MSGPEYTEAMIRAAEVRFMVTVLEEIQRETAGLDYPRELPGLTLAMRALRARAEHLERLDQAL